MGDSASIPPNYGISVDNAGQITLCQPIDVSKIRRQSPTYMALKKEFNSYYIKTILTPEGRNE